MVTDVRTLRVQLDYIIRVVLDDGSSVPLQPGCLEKFGTVAVLAILVSFCDVFHVHSQKCVQGPKTVLGGRRRQGLGMLARLRQSVRPLDAFFGLSYNFRS